MWRHNCKMAAMTSFHAEKCWHPMSAHAASSWRLCSSVYQLLIYSTLLLVSSVNPSSKFGGGTKRRMGWVWSASPPGEGSGEWEFFCFVLSKWHISVNSEVLNLKFFLSWAPSMGFGSIVWKILDFWAKPWIKDIYRCCHWARMTNIGLPSPKVLTETVCLKCHWRQRSTPSGMPGTHPQYFGWGNVSGNILPILLHTIIIIIYFAQDTITIQRTFGYSTLQLLDKEKL